MKNDRITQRIYVLGTLETTSPLIIGSGEDDLADIQLMRGGDGTPFIPGSAIAGATRHFLKELLPSQQKAIDLLYGAKVDLKNSNQDTTQSLITFYDLFPKEKITPAIRDGVRLDYETKTAMDTFKYDYEIIERGQQFAFECEVAFRNNHPDEQQTQMRELLANLCSAMMQKQITLGAKTRRGFGEVSLKDAKMLTLNMPDDAQTWIDFQWNDEYFQEHHAETISPKMLPNRNRTEMSVTFEIPYSILIRHESGNPSDPDVTHLTSNDDSIIPGTSWNGALRHAIYDVMQEILRDLEKSKADEMKKSEAEESIQSEAEEIGRKITTLLTGLFGDVDKTTKQAKASRVMIKESVITNGQRLTYTRNKVDRFTCGVVDSALFDEQPHYGGSVTLDIAIKQAADWEKGLLLLALKDIGNGIQPIGGEANVGRGILMLQHCSLSNDDERTFLAALATYLRGGN